MALDVSYEKYNKVILESNAAFYIHEMLLIKLFIGLLGGGGGI